MIKSDEQRMKEGIRFLRTVEPIGGKPDMGTFELACGTPSCAAGYLRFREGKDLALERSEVEELLESLLGPLDEEGEPTNDGWNAVFSHADGWRLHALSRLGIEMDPGADTGTQALRDAADRLEAVALKLGFISEAVGAE